MNHFEVFPEGCFGRLPLEISCRRVLLVDRDGTLHQRNRQGYVSRIPELDITGFEVVWELLLDVARSGTRFIQVTNQGGIARKLYEKRDVDRIYTSLQATARDYGFEFSGYLACPHHPVAGSCLCRKPLPLMLSKIIKMYGLTNQSCAFLGDSDTDHQAAIAAGIRFFPVHTLTDANYRQALIDWAGETS